MDDDQRESGRIPRTVECELTADLGTQYVSCLLLLSYNLSLKCAINQQVSQLVLVFDMKILMTNLIGT